jgi:acyl-CoA dehydrogenase
VSTANATVSVEKNLAGEPRALLRFNAAPVVAIAALEGAASRLMAEGALFRSVQMAGALERALEYTLLYANERVQFGRPIGKFQAIQHLLAVLAGHTAAASAAADAAVEASQLAPDEFAVAVAKSRTGEAAGKGAEIAHQVHGAMGYTREHNLHYCTRRLWSWRDEFGNETWWQTRLGHMVAAKGADALWPLLTAG